MSSRSHRRGQLGRLELLLAVVHQKDMLGQRADHRSPHRLVAGLCVAALAVTGAGACSTTGAHRARPAHVQSKPRHRLQLEPIKLIAKGGGADDIEVLDALGLFEAGGRLLEAGKYPEAIRHYDRLAAHFPRSKLLPAALYNSGLAHERTGDFAGAAERYRKLAAEFAGKRDAVDALFRLGGCYAELRRWKESAKVFAQLRDRKGSSAGDRVEAFAREGLAYFRLEQHDAAERTFRRMIEFARQVESVERLDNDFFLAMGYYYLAAIPHVRFRQLKVSPGREMGKQLDTKAKHLLASQSRYIATIRLKNPYWATAAGFQIGSLYREFYTTLMTVLPDFDRVAKRNAHKAKIPVAQAKKQLVQIYLQEVHKKIRPLLHKAIRVFEKNVVIAERIGVENPWVAKSRRQMRELKRLLTVDPSEAVELVPKDGKTPEDQAGEPRRQSSPTPPPAKPGISPEPFGPGQRTIL